MKFHLNKSLKRALILLIFFATLDVLLTYVGLTNGGQELNPFANRIWNELGIIGLMIGKLILIGLILILVSVSDTLLARGLVWTAIGVQIVAVAIGGIGLVSIILK